MTSTMTDDDCWWQIPRRLVGFSMSSAAAALAAGEGGGAGTGKSPPPPPPPPPPSPSPSPSLSPSPPLPGCLPAPVPNTNVDLVAQYAASIAHERPRSTAEEESDSTEETSYSESDDSESESESESEALPHRLATGEMKRAPGPMDVPRAERPKTGHALARTRRPATAPSPHATPLPLAKAPPSPAIVSPLSPPYVPSLGTSITSSSLSPIPCVRAAAQALAQRVQSAVSSISGRGGGGSGSDKGSGSVGSDGGSGKCVGARWPNTTSSVASNSALCHMPLGSRRQHHSDTNNASFRRVPPASLMASPWWRNMEEQSPAFAAVSQRFHAIAHAQARERLASNLARLAVLHEAEAASRDSQDVLRRALGMPALARWARTKADEPLPAFLVRTVAAMLDLTVELVKHVVLMGWVLLGVFNRLLFEVMTANRPIQTAVMVIAVIIAGYTGLLGDFQDIASLFGFF